MGRLEKFGMWFFKIPRATGWNKNTYKAKKK